MLFAKFTFAGFSETFTSGTTTVSIPPGAAQVQVQAWGGGGGGGWSRAAKLCNNYGAGGGGGAYVRKTIPIPSANWGQNISYSVGGAGVGGVFAPSVAPTAGGNTSVSSGTFTIPTPIAAPGGGAGPGGAAGALSSGPGGSPASGGDCGFNINGNPGGLGSNVAAGPGGTALTTPGGTSPSSSAGGGGPGGAVLCTPGNAGSAGQVIFTWS